ncbi:HAD-IA family hydrolase [Jatrophihabitans sp. DSM 45814]
MSARFEIPCRAILFDSDGVLVDSKASGDRAWARWANERGLDPSIVLDGVHGRRSVDTVARYLPEAERASGLEAIDDLEIADADTTKPIAGATDLLRTLPDNWAVVTSASTALLSARFTAAGLKLPRVVVASTDVSAGKPAPDGYLLAADRLSVPISDCIVVEDSLNGIRAGRSAGAGHVLGIGSEAVQSDADSVVIDLRACSWTGTGLQVGPEFVLRAG